MTFSNVDVEIDDDDALQQVVDELGAERIFESILHDLDDDSLLDALKTKGLVPQVERILRPLAKLAEDIRVLLREAEEAGLKTQDVVR